MISRRGFGPNAASRPVTSRAVAVDTPAATCFSRLPTNSAKYLKPTGTWKVGRFAPVRRPVTSAISPMLRLVGNVVAVTQSWAARAPAAASPSSFNAVSMK